jgi:Fe-S-cluster containining protein
MRGGKNMQHEEEYRPCGDCTACCKGHLTGVAYGNEFKNHKPCVFLCQSKKCLIYDSRPSMCINYQCAWTQKLLPEDMKPDMCGLIVSVKKDENGEQYLEAVEIIELVPYHSYMQLNQAAKKLNVKWIKVPYHR